jgi:hypothetical protein
MDDNSNNTAKQMDVFIPRNFASGRNYIPIAQMNNVGGMNLPAIGQYTAEAPTSGTYVLGSKNGQIQWIATEDCDE